MSPETDGLRYFSGASPVENRISVQVDRRCEAQTRATILPSSLPARIYRRSLSV